MKIIFIVITTIFLALHPAEHQLIDTMKQLSVNNNTSTKTIKVHIDNQSNELIGSLQIEIKRESQIIAQGLCDTDVYPSGLTTTSFTLDFSDFKAEDNLIVSFINGLDKTYTPL